MGHIDHHGPLDSRDLLHGLNLNSLDLDHLWWGWCGTCDESFGYQELDLDIYNINTYLCIHVHISSPQ